METHVGWIPLASNRCTKCGKEFDACRNSSKQTKNETLCPECFQLAAFSSSAGERPSVLVSSKARYNWYMGVDSNGQIVYVRDKRPPKHLRNRVQVAKDAARMLGFIHVVNSHTGREEKMRRYQALQQTLGLRPTPLCGTSPDMLQMYALAESSVRRIFEKMSNADRVQPMTLYFKPVTRASGSYMLRHLPGAREDGLHVAARLVEKLFPDLPKVAANLSNAQDADGYLRVRARHQAYAVQASRAYLMAGIPLVGVKHASGKVGDIGPKREILTEVAENESKPEQDSSEAAA